MCYRYLFLSLLFITAAQRYVRAQSYEYIRAHGYEIEFIAGYSAYTSENLKTFQNDIISQNPLSLKATDRFPSRPYLQLALNWYRRDGNRLGFFMGYHSTGGRLAVSDYSGKVISDQILTNIELGMTLNVYLRKLKSKHVTPFMGAKMAAALSRLELKDMAYLVNGEKYKDKLTLNAENLTFTPSLGLETSVYDFPLRISAGYLIQVTALAFHLQDSWNAKLRMSDDTKVIPGLSGFRFSISVAITQ